MTQYEMGRTVSYLASFFPSKLPHRCDQGWMGPGKGDVQY